MSEDDPQPMEWTMNTTTTRTFPPETAEPNPHDPEDCAACAEVGDVPCRYHQAQDDTMQRLFGDGNAAWLDDAGVLWKWEMPTSDPALYDSPQASRATDV